MKKIVPILIISGVFFMLYSGLVIKAKRGKQARECYGMAEAAYETCREKVQRSAVSLNEVLHAWD